jgi:hypothetical protein
MAAGRVLRSLRRGVLLFVLALVVEYLVVPELLVPGRTCTYWAG